MPPTLRAAWRKQKDVHEMKISSVNGGGEAPFQALLPVPFSSNNTVDNHYTLEVGQGDVTPPEPEMGAPCHIGRERMILCLLGTVDQQQLACN
jgi:hypothetical protein